MRITFLFMLVPFMLTLSSCDDDDGSQESRLNYTGYIPNFSVNTPQNSFTESSSMLKSAEDKDKIVDLEQEVTSGSRIDCSEQLKNWQIVSLNAKYNLLYTGDPTSGCERVSHVFCESNRIGMILNLYVQSQFYDCNVRQQLQEDGLTKRCVLRTGEAGTSANMNNIGADDLCSQRGLDSVDVQLLYAYRKDEERPDDNTRFISWTMDPNDSSTEDLEGLMINKYLHDAPVLNGDHSRAKTRVDLDRINGFKSINSTDASYKVSGELEFITRVNFREAGGNDKIVTDSYIVGRHWAKLTGKVLVIRGHLKSNVGSSVFYKHCDAATEELAKGSPCDLDSSTTGTYFNSSGAHVTSPPSGVVTAWNDPNFNPPSGDHFASFFNSVTTNNQVIADYFNPDLFSPNNPASSVRE